MARAAQEVQLAAEKQHVAQLTAQSEETATQTKVCGWMECHAVLILKQASASLDTWASCVDAVLRCPVLCCAALYCVALGSAALRYAELFLLPCAVLCCATLCWAVCCAILFNGCMPTGILHTASYKF